ncbi:MAG: hypothetical protein HRT35_21945 [Algicola sp.]|nr:hypothetical protein [Algicola sp.]
MNIAVTQVTDITAISGLSNLVNLNLAETFIQDLKPYIFMDNNWTWVDLSRHSFCWQLDYIEYRHPVTNYTRPWGCDNSDNGNDYDGDGQANEVELWGLTDPFIDDYVAP